MQNTHNVFTVHTLQSAPEKSRSVLEQLKSQVGFVPNLAATMAESPNLIEAFVHLRKLNGQGSLSPVEREAVALSVSFVNRCSYCMAAHSTFAKMNGASEEVLAALRSGRLPNNSRLAALTLFAQEVIQTKGQLPAETVDNFVEAGFTRTQLLEVILVVITTAVANYVHNVAGTPLDVAFEPQAWAVNS